MVKLLQQLWKLTIASEALRQSAVLVIGSVASGLIMAFAMILTSRSLGPEKFGVFAVSIAVMGLLAKGVDLGLNQLIPKLLNKWHRDQKKANSFLGQLVLWKLWLIVSTIVISLASIPLLVRLLHYPYVDMLLWALVGALVMGLYEYVYLILTARHKFFLASVLTVLQAMIKMVGFVAFFLFSSGNLNGITGAYYVAPFLAVLAIAWQGYDSVWIKPAATSAPIKREMLTFLRHTFVGVIAMTLIANLDVLLVQSSLNEFETGLYAGAGRIASFIAFATASIGGVLNNRVSRYSDVQTLKKYLLKSSSMILLAGVGFLMYLPLARLSLTLTIGDEYINGLPALIILVLNGFLSFAIVPFISFFYAVDHPKYFSIGGILQVTIIALGNWFFLPTYGIQAAAWSRVAATTAFMIFTFGYVLYAMRKLSIQKSQ